MSSSANETQFESILIQLKLPYVREYRFSKRRWRFDFAIPEKKLAFEVEGGIWQTKPNKQKKYQVWKDIESFFSAIDKEHQGRHQTAIGFMKDCQKYEDAQSKGWYVFRIPAPWLFHTDRQKTQPYLMTYNQVKKRVKKLYDSRPDLNP